jgi:hypothetical protein
MKEGARAVHGSQMSSRCQVWISIHGRNRECGVDVQLSKDSANRRNVRSRPSKPRSAIHHPEPVDSQTCIGVERVVTEELEDESKPSDCSGGSSRFQREAWSWPQRERSSATCHPWHSLTPLARLDASRCSPGSLRPHAMR